MRIGKYGSQDAIAWNCDGQHDTPDPRCQKPIAKFQQDPQTKDAMDCIVDRIEELCPLCNGMFISQCGNEHHRLAKAAKRALEAKEQEA